MQRSVTCYSPDNSAPRAWIMPLGGDGSLDQRRVYKPSGSGIDGGHRVGHAEATGEVGARSFGHRSFRRSTAVSGSSSPRGRRRRARNGRKGLGAFLSHAEGCLSTYLGVVPSVDASP